jgi:hypothetical protein
MDEQKAWENFCKTGTVSSYLAYAQQKQKGQQEQKKKPQEGAWT